MSNAKEDFRGPIDGYIHQHLDFVLDMAMELCVIPSMTGQEEKKASYIANKLSEICGVGARIDEIGNVLCTQSAVPGDRRCVYAAHMDTVFRDAQLAEPVQKGSRIYAPSILDNSINLAGLIFSIKLIKELKIPLPRNILCAFDVGEEGFGNSKGIRHIVESGKDCIDEVIAVDLGYDSIINEATGSIRYSVAVETQGGHSWIDFGRTSAIAIAADIVKDLYSLDLPPSPKTTYNVGTIRGGTSVNTIAPSCEFTIDLRSVDAKCLRELDRQFQNILEKSRNPQTGISCILQGERPCGRLPQNSALERRLLAVRKELGLSTRFKSGSTDANIPLSLGIPAVSFGVCNGGGAHTAEEYIETDSLETGLRHLVYYMIKE